MNREKIHPITCLLTCLLRTCASGSCSAVNPAGNNTQLQVTLRFNLILITPVISQATADHIILRAASVFRTEY